MSPLTPVDTLRSASYRLEIHRARMLPLALSVFLAPLGMSQRQCRATVAVQAFVLAAAGLVAHLRAVLPGERAARTRVGQRLRAE